jgi:hypothetical protein
MLFNLIKGIGISKTGRSKNVSHSAIKWSHHWFCPVEVLDK